MLKPKATLRIVHGFAVASVVFRPLIRRLQCASLEPTLFRYPSIGLPLSGIVDRVTLDLRERRPDAILAHSLGCIATWLAVHRIGWHGPIVLIAPPFLTIPVTRLIPDCLRWPFAPLLDHREITSEPNFRLPSLAGCKIKTIAGRIDLFVPLRCTSNDDVDDSMRSLQTHNSMLFSAPIASACADWVARHHTASNHPNVRGESS